MSTCLSPPKLYCLSFFRLLLITAGLHKEDTVLKKNQVFQSDREATVDKLVKDIKNEFPSLTSSNKQAFMVKSKDFIENMIKSPSIEDFLLSFVTTDKCEKC